MRAAAPGTQAVAARLQTTAAGRPVYTRLQRAAKGGTTAGDRAAAAGNRPFEDTGGTARCINAGASTSQD